MKRFTSICFLLILTTSAIAQPTSKPAISPDEAIQNIKQGAAPQLTARIEEALRKELAADKPSDANIVQLASLRVFAARFGELKPASAEEVAALEWMVKHPVLGPLLLLALSPRDDPARVLAVLTALKKEFGKGIEQFPDLTVAACVVWDAAAKEDQTAAQADRAACEVFGHLTRNRQAMRFDPQVMPWQVALYLVDSHVTPEERQWALHSYKLPQRAGDAYFQIAYDVAGFYSGQWHGGGGKERPAYTLANLKRLGGVCKDQAYFTVEVCRAYGVPATVCTGQCNDGEGFHAWVGLLAAQQKRAAFDFSTARYPEHGFWSGTVIDPQTGQTLTDGEVAMVAEWCAVSSERRLLSLALSHSVDLIDTSSRRIVLCKRAIETAPANAQAWMSLAEECTRPDAPPAAVGELAAVVEKFAIGRYDNFAFKLISLLISSRKPEDQLATLDRAAGLFVNRPDLAVQMGLLKGDILRKLARPVDALKVYEQLLTRAAQYGPILLDVMERIDAMLRAAGKMRTLLEHYDAVWKKMPAAEASGYAWTTPWYIMGDRFAKALEDAGEKSGAEKVRKAIRERDKSHHGERPA